MTQSIADPVVTKRHVHANGTVSHFHVRRGQVLLTSVHPEHIGNPAEIGRDEIIAAWDKVTAEARDEGLIP